jgi:hypothetical protein
MYNSMIFPATVDEFMEEYKVVDSEHVYSNGMEMVPIFRMKQWFEHEANHNAEPGKMVNRELNLSLTARESAFVKVALIRLRDDEKRCARAMRDSNVVGNVSDYVRDVKDIENILNKIERMADGTR